MRTALSLTAVVGLLLVTGAVDAPLPLAQGFPAAYSYQVQLAGYASELQWYFCNPGDYNMDGEVKASDVTEIGRYFGAVHPLGQFYISDARLQVDGDQNGEINQADLVVIASHYGNDVLGGYNVYCSSSESDYPYSGLGENGPGAVLLGNLPAEPPLIFLAKERGLHRFKLTDPDPEAFYWVRAVSSSGEVYRSSDAIQLSQQNPPTINLPPTGPEEAADLTFQVSDNKLFWYYQNSGDYNQNSQVEATDLVTISLQLGQEVAHGYMNDLYVVDGDKDGVITLADSLPIRRNFGTSVTTYILEGFEELDSTAVYWDEILFSDSSADGGRRIFEYSMEWAPSGYYRVTPYGSEGIAYPGIPSNWVYVP